MKPMLFIGAGVAVAFWALWPRSQTWGPVTIRVLDPNLQISEARLVPWRTNLPAQCFYRVTWANRLGELIVPLARKLKVHLYPHQPAHVEWDPDPHYAEWNNDVLVLLGDFKGRIKPFGFDLVATNLAADDGFGNIMRDSVGFGRAGHLVLLTNEFASANFFPPGTRGSFKLRFHEETNDLAEVTIR